MYREPLNLKQVISLKKNTLICIPLLFTLLFSGMNFLKEVERPFHKIEICTLNSLNSESYLACDLNKEDSSFLRMLENLNRLSRRKSESDLEEKIPFFFLSGIIGFLQLSLIFSLFKPAIHHRMMTYIHEKDGKKSRLLFFNTYFK